MARYILRRGLMGLLTAWAVTVLAYVIIQLPPGDYISSYLAQLESSGTFAGEEEAVHLRELYGLNEPVLVQYGKWMSQVLRGNFGISFEWKKPVSEVIGERLGLTVLVALAAVLATWAFALPIGIYSAVRQYSLGDHAFTILGFAGVAIPNFLFALVLMYFSYQFLGISVGGLFSPDYVDAPWSVGRFADLMKHLWIPALILGTGGAAHVIRVMRANLLDELRKPYVVTARAKGLSEMRAIVKYPVRVALNPFISTIGYTLPYLMSGSIIVSIVLNLPTVGPVLLRSLIAQDMFLAGTIVMFLGLLTVIGTLISDVLLAWADPRIRLERM
jgi:peptide/nickel transport system permease protein